MKQVAGALRSASQAGGRALSSNTEIDEYSQTNVAGPELAGVMWEWLCLTNIESLNNARSNGLSSARKGQYRRQCDLIFRGTVRQGLGLTFVAWSGFRGSNRI